MANVSSNDLAGSLSSNSHSSRRKRKHKSRKKGKKSQNNQPISLKHLANQIPESNSILSKQSQSIWKQWANTRSKKQISRNSVNFNNEFPSLSNDTNTMLKNNNTNPKIRQSLNNIDQQKLTNTQISSKINYLNPMLCNIRNDQNKNEQSTLKKSSQNSNGSSSRYATYKRPKIDFTVGLSKRRMRMKMKKQLDAELLIRNMELAKLELTPLQKYIDHLLHFSLNEETTEFVLEQLTKLPWNDTKIRNFVTNRLYNIITMSFEKIGYIAAIIAGLDPYYGISLNIVDSVCEEIRIGLEKENDVDVYDSIQEQRRLLCIKFLGELYKHELVDVQVIMDTLYLIVMYNSDGDIEGFVSSIQKKTAIDFRICLCCMLLEVCGEYLRSKTLKMRCDRFVLYFQRFIAMNAPIPVEIQWWVYDVLDFVAPNMKKYYVMYHDIDGLKEILGKIDELERKDILLKHKDALLVLNKDHDGEFVREYDRMMKQHVACTATIENKRMKKSSLSHTAGLIIPIRVLSKNTKHFSV